MGRGAGLKMVPGPADCLYLTHPQVRIDPDVPVPDWSLSEKGLGRARLGLLRPEFASLGHIVSSGERKAIETAAVFADRFGLELVVDDLMHENDRSSTGFLPPEEFERVADAFFGSPHTSVRGWERACDAQARIVDRVAVHLERIPEDERVLFVGHGGVGTLLKCHLGGWAIDRRHDQPAGGGFFYSFARQALQERNAPAPDLAWRPVDR
ncbi:histidine phosphatase family protein [Stappia sp. TSB10GB4]|uniref:histidine phosphatase family protein n=1 Tax=Stappia sp. TSB10GB4 TaxID=2003584 RepID=UPI001FCE3CE3|nr:histidine phosphatase family protein [Stappia sp. TSB10GB4]